ncbi:hypothetical protein [Janthinobacterium sp. SUN033]|uniref:DUF6988 family protein n=1 Tax=Janthinobacterium sp. SUN033 TaxID=3002439 RepID=UPI0025AFE47F|nr:hypothetical protein [Janthinobacterium sp. SUN033]MDN2676722.1 hypothetical protein [Janthinobacterium sp. SUN033]
MQDDNLELALKQSAAISFSLQEILGGQGELDRRSYLAMAYLNLALDHREALLLLVQEGAFASATALQRSLLEAAVTGVWIDSCATDRQVEQIFQLKYFPLNFDKMAQKLRATHQLGEWFEVFRNHYKIFNDYTHGHNRQISRWLSSGSAGPHYDVGQMIETLHHSDLVGLVAAVQREKILDRPLGQLLALIETVLDRSRSAKNMPLAQ